jgi:hypothetical protein
VKSGPNPNCPFCFDLHRWAVGPQVK